MIRLEENELKNDLLVIKVKSGINVKADLMEHWRKKILRQKETGVVALPWFLEVVVVPKDVEVQIIDSRSDGFFGDDRDSLTQEQIENLQ